MFAMVRLGAAAAACRTTTFSLVAPGSAAPVTELCPGVAYELTVGYGAARRRTLLTTSVGAFKSAAGNTW
jgi:hypothetical protein